MTDRDRDAAGRARNSRPRDGLGRPLEYGAVGVERAPEGIVRTPDESLELAQSLLDAGQPFHAHEVLEDAWKQAPDAERDLWQGLAQVAVGLTHRERGNEVGARTLLERGTAAIAAYEPDPPHGIDIAAVRAQVALILAADPGSRRAAAAGNVTVVFRSLT